MGLDANQIIQNVHDSTNNALRVINLIILRELAVAPAGSTLETTEGVFWIDTDDDSLNFTHKDSGDVTRSINLGVMA